MISKGYVRGASMHRVHKWRLYSQSGTISAFRKYQDCLFENYSIEEVIFMERTRNKILEGYRVSKNENLKRDKQLRAILKNLRDKLGYIKVDGLYKESGSFEIKKEISYFVYMFDLSFDLKSFLLDTGRQFNQDSIAYAQKNGEYNLYCSTAQNYILGEDDLKYAFGSMMTSFKGMILDNENEHFKSIYSQIRGIPFVWDEYEATKVSDLTPSLGDKRI